MKRKKLLILRNIMFILQLLPTYSGCTERIFRDLVSRLCKGRYVCFCYWLLAQRKAKNDKNKKNVMNSDGKSRASHHYQDTAFRDRSLSHQKVELGDLTITTRQQGALLQGPNCTTCMPGSIAPCRQCSGVHGMLGYQNPATCQWQNQALLGSTHCENPSPAFFELLQKKQTLALTIRFSFF